MDEVLAVGDAAFQKKCLGKMQEVSTGGRTVLFVSHQMAAVQNLCQKGILLAGGRLVVAGEVETIVRHYMGGSAQKTAGVLIGHRPDRQGNGKLRFEGYSLKDKAGKHLGAFTSGDAAVFELALSSRKQSLPLRVVRIAVGVDDFLGQRILLLSSHLAGQDFSELPSDVARILICIPRMTLGPGQYRFTVFCSINGEISDWVRDAGTFDVEAGDFYSNGQFPLPGQGIFLIEHKFELSNKEGFESIE